MFPLLVSWVTKTVSFSSEVNIFLSITGSNSWGFSNPCCPQQGIFPSFIVQTLVSLSDNNRFVGWSYYSASRCCLLDVLVSRTLESLSIRKGWNLHIKKCIMWSFFDGVMTISVDRLLVPLLGLKYKKIVTLKSTYIITAVFWILSIIAGSFSISDTRLTRWLSGIVLTCSVISIAPYKERFRALSYHQAQV